MSAKFSIPLPPKTGNNQYGVRKQGGKYLLPGVRKWREDCFLLIPAIDFSDLGRPLLYFRFFTKDWKRVDLDNLMKPVWDCLKLAWGIDDSRFDLSGAMRLVDRRNPRVEIEVR